MLRIRLRRTGRKNRPFYRIVVAEHSAPLTGKFVDQLGHFDPRTKDVGIDNDRLMHWLNVGAQPSNRVAKLLTTAKINHKLIVVTTHAPRAPKNAPEVTEAPAAPVAAVEPTTESASESEPAAAAVEAPTEAAEPTIEPEA